MLFQVSDSKERNFLELTDDDLNLIEPSTITLKSAYQTVSNNT